MTGGMERYPFSEDEPMDNFKRDLDRYLTRSDEPQEIDESDDFDDDLDIEDDPDEEEDDSEFFDDEPEDDSDVD